MKYILRKERKVNLKNFGKYKAVAVHADTVTQQEIEAEAERNCTVTRADVKAVMNEVMAVMRRHLQNGDRVRLDDWGILKLELESKAVEQPEEFNATKHVKRIKVHFLPESRKGVQRLYNGIKLERA